MTTPAAEAAKPTPPPVAAPASTRLTSLDAYRGFVMFLMLAEALSLWCIARARPHSPY